jgi:competence protein ComEA
MRFPKSSWAAALAFFLSTCAGIASGQEKQSALPDGPGKESLQKVCSNCHELEAVTSARHTKAGWQQIVEDMIARGAEGSDEQMEAALSYLMTFFGKVNVNAASTTELEKSLDLSPKEAQAIVAYRERNGKIHDLEELKKIPGLSAERLQAKRALIAFAQ